MNRVVSMPAVCVAVHILLCVCPQIASAQNFELENMAMSPNLPVIMEVFGEYQEQLGRCVLALGDINADGWPDFGVGAYKSMEFRIYFGGPGILDSLPDMVLQGRDNAVLADINGDRINDLVTVKQNMAYFYLGRKDQPLRYHTQPDYRFIPHLEWDETFGLSLESGDLNRDGYADVALADKGGGGSEGHGHANGVVYIFMGTAIPDSTPTYTLVRPDSYFGQFGNVVQIGDVNGDGYDDLAAGREYQNYDTNPDILFNQKILFLGGPNFNPLFERPSQVVESNNIFGALTNGFLTDVNADGKDDLVFSYDNNGNVLYGTASGLAISVGRTIPRPGAMGWGGMVRLDHDITGDGYVDYVLYLLTFDQSWASFFYGSALGVKHEFAFNGNYLWKDDFADPARHRMCSIGDVNGDGRNDVLVSGTGTPGRRGVFQVLSGIGPPVATERTGEVPSTLTLTAIRPNPSSGPVEMNLGTPKSAQVQVTVHNTLGQEIRVLTASAYTPGTHTLRWNGADATGARVPPGVYLLHAASGSHSVTARVVMQ